MSLAVLDGVSASFPEHAALPEISVAFAWGSPAHRSASPPLRVLEVTGHEAISTFFELAVTLGSQEPIDASVAVGERAELTLSAGIRTRTVHGILKSFEQGDSSTDLETYRATLVPAAYVLALREDSRIFPGKTAPEIVAAVLASAGLSTRDYRFALQATYPAREHTVQYRESDWAFLLRLLSSEGMYAYFTEEADDHVLVIADGPLAHREIAEPAALPFRRDAGTLQTGERVRSFRHVEELRPGKIALRGYALRTPSANLTSHVETDRGSGDIYDAPLEYDSPGRGDALARLRLEHENTARAESHGLSDCVAMEPGVVFGLCEHPCEALNRRWLVTRIEHRYSATAGTYENRFGASPAEIPFRKATSAAKPMIGIQTAVVVGPDGQEVHCDDLGRVKVQFQWDREGRHDERSSSWIRVSQPWAGSGHGMLFIPRVGHQVLVDFAGGDCDRPIIVGGVFDAENAPPASLPAERTQTVLRATSTAGGAGFSELRMDADAGQEQLWLRSCRDLDVEAGRDRTEQTRRDERSEVGRDRAVQVARDETLGVRGKRSVEVGSTLRTVVGEDASIRVGGAYATEILGEKTEVVGRDLKLRVKGNEDRVIDGASRQAIAGKAAISAEAFALETRKGAHVAVAGAHEEQAGSRKIQAAELVELICGEATITASPDGTITLSGKNVRVKVAGDVEIEGQKLSVHARGAVNVDARGAVKVRGRNVSFN